MQTLYNKKNRKDRWKQW